MTLFKDAAMMKANPEMAGSILQDRLAQIQRFNDMGVPVDPKHTQEMMQLYQSGDMNAFSGYLDNVLESGYVTGALDRPPKPEEYTLAKGARRFSGSREIASNVPVEPGYTQLTTQEVKDLGLDETKQYQKSPQGQITAIGGGGQTFNIGGEELSPGLKKLDEIYAQEYYDWRSQRSTALSNMASIGQVLGKLERGEKLSGPAIGMQPDFIRAIMNPEATQAIETVQSVVQQNLRQVLGGQFAQQEAAQLLSRAFNPTLAPEYNAERLRKLYAQMEIAAEQKDAMSEYFEKNGSLSGYTGEQPNITDFYVAMSKYDIGDISNGYRYLGGDDQIQSSWEEVK
jgi:hypothetical protein